LLIKAFAAWSIFYPACLEVNLRETGNDDWVPYHTRHHIRWNNNIQSPIEVLTTGRI